jgi:copper chaperone CopZ
MGVAGVSACTVHLDTGAVRVMGAGVDATAVIAAVTAESYSCALVPSADIDDDSSIFRLLVIEIDSKPDAKCLSVASRALSQLPSVVSCIAVPSSSRIEIKGDSCLDSTSITRELRRIGLHATIVSFSPFSHLRIQIGPEVTDSSRARIKTLISSFNGVSSIAIDDAGHLVVHGAVEPARIMMLLEEEGMSAQPAPESEHVLVKFDSEECDDVSPYAQRLLAQSSANDDRITTGDRSSLTLVVQGMTCGACVAHVTSALSSIAGAENVSVNLITGSAHIRNWNGSNSDLISALESQGYGGHVVSAKEPVNFTKQADAHLRQWIRIFYCAVFVFAIQSFFTPQSHLRMTVMSDAAMSAKSR